MRLTLLACVTLLHAGMAIAETNSNVMDYYCYNSQGLEFERTVTVGQGSNLYFNQNGESNHVESSSEPASIALIKQQIAQQPKAGKDCAGYMMSLGSDSKSVDGVLGQLNFEAGSAELTEQARYTLYKLLPRLKRSTHLIIEGHADFLEAGRKESFELAAERAKAVADYLKEREAAPYDLVLMSKGASAPKADSNNMLGREINRRVELRY